MSLSPNSLAEAKARADALRQQLNQASHAYYVLAEPILPDPEYDHLYRELVELETCHPQLVQPDSPTQRVGEPVEAGLPSITHRIPLLSLDNVFAVEELSPWEQRLRRQLDGTPDPSLDPSFTYACELKVDGVALALRYEQGLLVQGATRGDGQRGEEITASVRTVRSIPLRLRCTDPPVWAEIRGEAFLAEATFSAINQQRRQQDEPPFANARNACAGTLRQLNPQVVASRKVDFLAYGLHLSPEQPQPRQQMEALDWLRAAGFKTDPHARRCLTLAEVGRFYQHWNLQRHHLPHGADGVVVKLNDLALQQQAGHTQRAPRWAVAMKFSQVEARSRLRRLVVQVGRTGVATPVAEFEPVQLDGSTVARATLHNADRIEDLTQGTGLHGGAVLVVRKAGGVIPEVVRVEPCSSPGEPLAFPSHCPECGSLLVRESRGVALRQWLSNADNQHLLDHCPILKASLLEALTTLETEAATRCVNSSCPAILRGALRHWVSRDALDVDGLGRERIDQLVGCGLVHTIDDLYGLQEAELTALEGWAGQSACRLLQSLETSRRQPWHRVLYGLGIPHVGSANAAVLASAFPSVEDLVAAFVQYQGADEPLLAGLPGMSPGIALSLQGWLRDPANKTFLADHEVRKHYWWPLVLSGLGIPHVGPEKAKTLAQAFPSGDQLVAAFMNDQVADEPLPASLQSVAPRIQTWLSDPTNRKRLADHEACKERWWPLVLSGLRKHWKTSEFPPLGPEKAKVLAQAFPSTEQLADAFAVNRQFQGAGEHHLADLEGIGPEIAFSLQTWFGNPANQKLLERLAKAGLQLQSHTNLSTEPAPGPLTGQTFVLTGTLPSLRRGEAQKRIEAAGGTVGSSVTRKTTHLVVGANPSSKLDKARALGIEILDEAELLQRLASPQDLPKSSALPKTQQLGDDLPLLMQINQEGVC